MSPAKPTTSMMPRRAAKAPTREAIIRAVASSTAIETGQSIQAIERRLRDSNHSTRKLMLAR
ncbi:MAG: hypothetical protein ACREPT_01525 [Rudaea sp.]